MTRRRQLPKFIVPMACQPGKPFDSEDYYFEIKWDGTRALAFIDDGAYRLMNRREADITHRFPEFAFLSDWPGGTVLDGEMIVLTEGKPDFAKLQARDHLQTEFKIRTSARSMPATFMVFDLLYSEFENIMNRPWSERRQRLEEIIAAHPTQRVALSQGVHAQGIQFYEAAIAQNLEGVVGKRMTSPYQPGKRIEDWIKVKKRLSMHCVVIGYLLSEKVENELRSLILASDVDGKLTYVGKVGSGLSQRQRSHLLERLIENERRQPVIDCDEKGRWVDPTIYCIVSYTEVTGGGHLRDPVFEQLVE